VPVYKRLSLKHVIIGQLGMAATLAFSSELPIYDNKWEVALGEFM